jgi:hypothetical protein
MYVFQSAFGSKSASQAATRCADVNVSQILLIDSRSCSGWSAARCAARLSMPCSCGSSTDIWRDRSASVRDVGDVLVVITRAARKGNVCSWFSHLRQA